MVFTKPHRIYGIALLCGFCALSVYSSVYAIGYGGIGGQPAYPRADQPRSKTIFIHTLEPGTVQEEGIIVLNTTAEEKTILVNSVDSTHSTGGGLACKHRQDSKTKTGTWITMETTEVVLAGGESSTIPFTITIPEGIAPGEYNACIVLEEEAPEKTETASGLILSTRVGLRVALTIPGDLVRELKNPAAQVHTKENGDFIFQTTVENPSTTSIDTEVSVTVRSLLFGLLYTKVGGIFPTFRETVAEWNFEVAKPFWGGPYIASTKFQYDTDNDGKHDTVEAAPAIFLLVFPHMLALGIEIAVILGIFVIIILLIRRKNMRRRLQRMRGVQRIRRQTPVETDVPKQRSRKTSSAKKKTAARKKTSTKKAKRTRRIHVDHGE